MIEMILQWPAELQMQFLLWTFIAACVTIWLLVVSALHTARVLLRGYPPPSLDQQECHDEDNLKGYCLKPGGCRSTDECQDTLSSIHLKRKE